jgi:hypothetical protein
MRVLNVLLLAACFGSVGLAQTSSPQGATGQAAQPANPPAQVPLAVETDAREVRAQFEELLRKYPPDLGRILKMDPTMLANQQYLAQYPAVQQFLAAHPEIMRNPSFYLQFVQLATTTPVPRIPAARRWKCGTARSNPLASS